MTEKKRRCASLRFENRHALLSTCNDGVMHPIHDIWHLPFDNEQFAITYADEQSATIRFPDHDRLVHIRIWSGV